MMKLRRAAGKLMFSLSRSSDRVQQNILFEKHSFSEEIYKLFMENITDTKEEAQTKDEKTVNSINIYALKAVANFSLYQKVFVTKAGLVPKLTEIVTSNEYCNEFRHYASFAIKNMAF
jgi:hypothetical protein